MAQLPPYWTGGSPFPQPSLQQSIAQQQTLPLAAVRLPTQPVNNDSSVTPAMRRRNTRVVAVFLALALSITIYLVWHSSTATTPLPSVIQQNFGTGTSNTSASSATPSTTTSGTIQVYVVGAVKHPGVYTLPADARVFQLLQAAGGPLSNANLVAINLAEKLNDGEEVYVTMVGETPPTYTGGVPGPITGNGSTPGTNKTTSSSVTASSGQLVNINTASVDEMRLNLHVSSTTAQNIMNFRMQHGPYTSVDQLLQVVSNSIYSKIKGLVTV